MSLALPARPVTSTATHRPELDTFRAAAVLLVIWEHWLPSSWVPFDTGGLGVTGFFVLSGLLITGILRRARSAAGAGRWQVLSPFYVRRALRILPAYYLVVGISWVLRLSFVREHLPWFALHGANLLFFRQLSWGEGTGHLWSLAVEEQFYLVWPLLVLLVPVPHFRTLLGLLAVLGPLVRWALLYATGTSFALILPPACLDLFAIGGLLGLVLEQVSWPAVRWTGVGVALLVAYLFLEKLGGAGRLILGPTLQAGAAAGLLAAALSTTAPRARRLLTWPAFVFLGRISYGVYLYHLMLPVLLYRVLHRVGTSLAGGAYYQALMDWGKSGWQVLPMLAILVAVAAFSWRFVERPVRELGRRWQYPVKNQKPASTR
ncbi:acyltransferase [Hymenobacter jejuensis]|uniref:Acyltransferase n=1 Tax=Hymenobacter jejuensis TaxID=2502781 RepID=A0A5B8A1Y5_9BACT|nr:acyltransferase [Hymenobacter jejuensis]